MTSLEIKDKENILTIKTNSSQSNFDYEEPMDIDSSILGSKIENNISNTQLKETTIKKPEINIELDDSKSSNEENCNIKATENIIFDSIFSNESDFQSFLDILEKKEVDLNRRSPKFSEFARKSLYLQFDPFVQKMSSTLSPEKAKRLSFLREKQEAIKIYLDEIEEENLSDNLRAPIDSASKSPAGKMLEQEALEFIKQTKTHINNHLLNKKSDLDQCLNTLESEKSDERHDKPINESVCNESHKQTYNDDSVSLEKELKSCPQADSISKFQILQGIESTENEKKHLETIQHLQEENSKFKTIAIEFERIFHNLLKDKDENETKLKTEILELTKERDHLQEDVIGVEKAFDDLHRRFEKLKTKVEEFKKNEEQLQKNNDILHQQIEKEKQKYTILKKHAEEKLELANNEIDKLRKSTSVEIQTLKAELRRGEIKISSLELSVQQKDQENIQLTNLLEDLLSKVKPT